MTREEFVNRWEGEFVAYDDVDFLADLAALLNALLDAERAAAREEQREVDACSCPSCHGVGWVERQIDCPFCSDSTHGHVCPEGTERYHCACGAARLRSMPLTATPLADRIAELERERDEAKAEAARLAELHRRCEAYDDQPGPSCVDWKARALKAEAALQSTAEAQREACVKSVADHLGPGDLHGEGSRDDCEEVVRATPLVTDEGKR